MPRVQQLARDDILIDAKRLATVTSGSASIAHNILSGTHADATTTGATRGDIIVANSTPAWDVLNVGVGGTVLYSDGTDTAWSATVGLGVHPPDGTLHVHTATAGAVTAHADADQLIVENSMAGGISILVPDASAGNLYFGSPSDEAGAYVRWTQNIGELRLGPVTALGSPYIVLTKGDGAEAVRIIADGSVGIGISVPLAQTHVDQSSASGAIPVLLLDQGDVSEQHILLSMNGADVDFPAILQLDVTGTPTLYWIDATEMWNLSDNLTLSGTMTIGSLGAGFVQSSAGGLLSSAAIIAGDLASHTHSGAGQGGSLTVGTTDTDATAGSVLFAGAAGVIQQDNANLFWDDGNNRLGIGLVAPTAPLHVAETGGGVVLVLEQTGADEVQLNYKRDGVVEWGMIDQANGFGFYDWVAAVFRVYIRNTGSVGIGTISPDNPLELLSATTPQFRITHTDATDYCTISVDSNGKTTITTVDGGGATGHLILAPDGNVGIGTATPGVKFDVRGPTVYNEDGSDFDFRIEAVGVSDAFQVQGSDGEITLGVLGAGFVQSTAGGVLSSAAIGAGDLAAHTHSGAGQGGSLSVGTTDTDATAGSVFFAGVAGVIQEDNANFFWDDGNDRLGIGIAIPIASLHVAKTGGGGVLILEQTSTDEVQLNYKRNSVIEWGLINQAAGFGLYDWVAGAFRVYVETSGDVGIGTISPDNPLELLSATTPQFRITHTDGVDYATFSVDGNGKLAIATLDGGGSAGHITLNPDGNVGIGLVSPTALAKVTITNNIDEHLRLESSSTTGDPQLSFAQTNTRRSYIQHLDTNDEFRIVGLYGSVQLYAATGGAAQLRMTIGSGGPVFIGTHISDAQVTAPGELSIDQGAADDFILALKSSSDVAHGITDIAETQTYGYMAKIAAANGGLFVGGLTETTVGISIGGLVTSEDDTRSTVGLGAVQIAGFLKDGAGIGNMNANQNILVIRNNATTRFIFDTDGSAHADVEWIAFSEHDDIAVLDTLERTLVEDQHAIPAEFGGWIDENKTKLERLGIAHFDDTPGHAMVNWTRLSMLLVGALRQTGARLAKLEQRMMEA